MGEVRETVFSFLLFFFSLSLFLYLSAFIHFAALPFSLVRWSLTAVVAVSEELKEILS